MTRHEQCGGAGYLSANEPILLVGLGAEEAVETLEVSWPSGRRDKWQNLPADRSWLFIEGRDPTEREVLSSARVR